MRAAEVALRVRGTPLDLAHNADVDCADVFGGDVSGANVGSRADDNPWAIYLPSPNCVYLNLQFDLTVNKPVADGSDVLVYTLHAKNLSTLTQNNVQIIARYAGSEFGFVGADNGGAVLANCPAGAGGSGNTCIGWPSITLPPSAERTYTFRLSVGGQGSGANVVFGNFSSTGLPAPGFTTQALTIVKPVARVAGAPGAGRQQRERRWHGRLQRALPQRGQPVRRHGLDHVQASERLDLDRYAHVGRGQGHVVVQLGLRDELTDVCVQ